jgi:hypothetical protein
MTRPNMQTTLPDLSTPELLALLSWARALTVHEPIAALPAVEAR